MVDDYPKRAELWMVSLEAVQGSEIGKKRPALVVSNNRNNQFAETITVIPLTSRADKSYPFEASIKPGTSGLSVESRAKCNQIRTVSGTRLLHRIGHISPEEMQRVEQALLIHLAIFLH
ncbi:MAG: type II toxin-antitoxin system PemK/MazF family toxin [Candidatus Eremiobacteraeota bacterium]|nr:type II toxin-antitoxin system PemK/MazF family toxin [Candidatus Eremiobacteraeota bacterium]